MKLRLEGRGRFAALVGTVTLTLVMLACVDVGVGPQTKSTEETLSGMVYTAMWRISGEGMELLGNAHVGVGSAVSSAAPPVTNEPLDTAAALALHASLGGPGTASPAAMLVSARNVVASQSLLANLGTRGSAMRRAAPSKIFYARAPGGQRVKLSVDADTDTWGRIHVTSAAYFEGRMQSIREYTLEGRGRHARVARSRITYLDKAGRSEIVQDNDYSALRTASAVALTPRWGSARRLAGLFPLILAGLGPDELNATPTHFDDGSRLSQPGGHRRRARYCCRRKICRMAAGDLCHSVA